jgi:hypothetical protein
MIVEKIWGPKKQAALSDGLEVAMRLQATGLATLAARLALTVVCFRFK